MWPSSTGVLLVGLQLPQSTRYASASDSIPSVRTKLTLSESLPPPGRLRTVSSFPHPPELSASVGGTTPARTRNTDHTRSDEVTMVRIRPQDLRARSVNFVLLLLILKTSLTTATPPLAQASVEDGPSIIVSPETENLSGNSTPPAPSLPQGSNSNSAPAPEKLPDIDLDTDSEGSKGNCSLNEQLEDGVCVCSPGFMVDPAAENPGDGGCPCEDTCNKEKCPLETNCVQLGCGVGYKCECKKGIYDVVSKTCEDACAMYGNAVCSFPGQVCKKISLDEFTCECDDEGYTTLEDGSCKDIDECEHPATACSSENKDCANTPGSFICTCKEGFVSDSNESCRVWEQCENPIWNPCDYKCDRETAGPKVTCSCPDGFNLQPNGDCVIDDESRQCECADLEEGTWYCRTNDDGVDVCLPKLGYGISENNETIDINECKEYPNLCGYNSACTNEPGGATCECLDGFIPSSIHVNGSFCKALICPPGQVPLESECVDPCSSSPCGGLGDVYTCRATADGTPECYCGGACMNQHHPSSNVSVYKGSLEVLQLPGGLDSSGYSRKAFVSSLETIFGRGTIDVTFEETNTQLRRRRQAGVPAFLSDGTDGQEPNPTTLKAVFDLVTMKSYSDAEDVATILSANCFDTRDDRCPLLGGVVLNRTTIKMMDNSNPCKNNPCLYPYTECKNNEEYYGRYTCECKAGFEPTGVPGACQDVDECSKNVDCQGTCINTPGSYYCEKKPVTHDDELRKQLDESEHTLTVVSAVLGTFLGLALVSTVVFVVLYVKRSKAPSTANISPDL
ncbi:uncharacterized protein LOC143024447 [Oratosquilla oratoria]|uniref:uncharacterized protein LOC143024447 n=1 Tax=Oratosquilla oratoria TaxID=337810 RepID=UPI003F76A585